VRADDSRSQIEAVPNLQNETDAVPDTYDDGGAPIGPSEEEEAAFLAAEGSSSHSFNTGPLASGARVEAGVDERASGPLPSLDELRARISPEVLGLMEELFRAKLTRVVRVNQRDLKEAKRSH